VSKCFRWVNVLHLRGQTLEVSLIVVLPSFTFEFDTGKQVLPYRDGAGSEEAGDNFWFDQLFGHQNAQVVKVVTDLKRGWPHIIRQL
jgi:hypothetical protein